MRTKSLAGIIAMVAIMISSLTVSAQQANGKGQGKNCNQMGPKAHCENFIPDLTEEQKTKIEALRLDMQKDMTKFRNELDIKRAELKALETAEKADMKAINKKIDEISAIKTNMRKKGAAHRQDVRSLLTEEQRIKFDARQGKMGKHGKKAGNCGGCKKGHGQGHGRGNGMGR